MWTRRSFAAACSALGVAALNLSRLRSESVRYATVTIANGVPLSVWSSDFSASTRGAGRSELRGDIEFRNEGAKPIRGLALGVSTPPGAPPSASVLLPALNAPARSTFTAPIRLSLGGTAGDPPWVEVSVDGCLADDLSFSGSDRRGSRRRLTVAELERRRERERLATVLGRDGRAGLEQELIRIERRRSGGPLISPAPAGSSAADRIEASVVAIDGAPLDIASGSALLSADRAGSPEVQVRNSAGRSIRSFEIGWAVSDRDGIRAFAGAILSASGLLAPRQATSASSAAAVEAGSGIVLNALTVYVRNAEFADGEFWLPSSEGLAAAGLAEVEPPSNEALRLIALRDREGIAAVVQALHNG